MEFDKQKSDSDGKLYLQTSQPNEKRWLSYILSIFREVTRIPVELVDSQISIPSNRIRILYASELPSGFDGIFIPELSIDDRTNEIPLHFNEDLTKGSVIQDAEIPIHHPQDTLIDNDGVGKREGNLAFQFDLLRNAFLRLSCAAERRLEQETGSQKSYRPKNIQPDLYEKPIVNYLFEILKIAIKQYLPADQAFEHVSSNKKNNILLSHDIDAVKRTLLKSIKQSAIDLYNVPRSLLKGRSSHAWKTLTRSVLRHFGADDYNQLERWQQIDRSVSKESVFHVYARTEARGLRNSFKRKIYDPDYDLRSDKVFVQQLRTLLKNEFSIGLHGSYGSYTDSLQLAGEKKLLEKAIDGPVDYIRQHWLRFSFQDTWHAQEEAGFKIDTGFGFNNQIGFRSWLAHSYHPWDEKNQRAHKIRVIPMVAMDSTLFDYHLLPEPEIIEKLQGLFEEVRKFEGRVNINWHTHGASRHLNWHHPYDHVLHS